MKRTVLVVDDDRAIRQVLQDYLETMDFSILHAEDGPSGWEAFQRERPDLVIADLYMPNMSGLELVQKIKADQQPAPVVLISGVPLSEREIQIHRSHADGFLDKPYMFWQMKELIAKLLPAG